MMLTPVEAAVIAARAEAMYPRKAPMVDVGAEFVWVADIYAKNALLLQRRMGLGEIAWFGYVAKHKALPLYIVAFRGTSSDSSAGPVPMVEWFEDMITLPGRHPVAGVVELGFWNIYASAMCNGVPLAAEVVRMLRADPGPVPYCMTIGHSLGAPLACYAALDIARSYGMDNMVESTMFASPLPGDSVFAAHFDTTIGRRNYDVWNYSRDMVPRCPPRGPGGLGYQPLLNVNRITPTLGKAKIADNVFCAHKATSYAALLGASVTSPCIEGANP